MFIIFRWIRLELLNHRGKKLPSHPSSLGESPIHMRIWLHESERVYMNIVWCLVWLVLLHLYYNIVVMEEGDKQGDKYSCPHVEIQPIIRDSFPLPISAGS
jgi:hypothetical protein